MHILAKKNPSLDRVQQTLPDAMHSGCTDQVSCQVHCQKGSGRQSRCQAVRKIPKQVLRVMAQIKCCRSFTLIRRW